MTWHNLRPGTLGGRAGRIPPLSSLHRCLGRCSSPGRVLQASLRKVSIRGSRPKAIIVPGSGAKRQPSSRSRHSTDTLVRSLSISTSANGLGPRRHLKDEGCKHAQLQGRGRGDAETVEVTTKRIQALPTCDGCISTYLHTPELKITR